MSDKKISRYKRIQLQISDLLNKSKNLTAQMATINAVLYYKMDGFFWVGFYLLENERLIVGPYQGPLACLELPRNAGVCWACINSAQPVIVPDVHQFPGHIACDSRSKSEIVIPLLNKSNSIIGVLDIDSNRINHFDQTDLEYLSLIVSMLQPDLASKSYDRLNPSSNSAILSIE
jgi:L-methionine (R)-S-oxide reductase